MFDHDGRKRKAQTMIAVLSDYINAPLCELSLLNIGGSAGIIDNHLSHYFKEVIGIDIDETAIEYAKNNFTSEGLFFELGDAMNLSYEIDRFDVIICSQVYEHVPDSKKLLCEMYRVLKPGGVIYFAAGNRIMINEPHYNLPFLSMLPRPLSHLYVKMSGKGNFYYEKHLTYFGLKSLAKNFKIIDYTPIILSKPQKYKFDYTIQPGSLKHKLARFASKYLIWIIPGYIWLLEKPDK